MTPREQRDLAERQKTPSWNRRFRPKLPLNPTVEEVAKAVAAIIAWNGSMYADRWLSVPQLRTHLPPQAKGYMLTEAIMTLIHAGKAEVKMLVAGGFHVPVLGLTLQPELPLVQGEAAAAAGGGDAHG